MNPAGVVVTLSDRHTELSGMLQTSTGQPASDVFVIAYAAERRFWGPGARRVQAVRPGVDGRYSIRDLPPGDYLIAAVMDVDQDDWQDPAFLEQLVPASIKIALDEGEKKAQDLRVGGQPARRILREITSSDAIASGAGGRRARRRRRGED